MAQYTPYLKLVFVGVLLASVLTGGFGLTVVALTALIAALLIATRPDVIPALIEKIRQAFTLENNTDYQLGDAGKVIAFLEQHTGKQVFTVSW